LRNSSFSVSQENHPRAILLRDLSVGNSLKVVGFWCPQHLKSWVCVRACVQILRMEILRILDIWGSVGDVRFYGSRTEVRNFTTSEEQMQIVTPVYILQVRLLTSARERRERRSMVMTCCGQ
jgi:hypothetical protein